MYIHYCCSSHIIFNRWCSYYQVELSFILHSFIFLSSSYASHLHLISCLLSLNCSLTTNTFILTQYAWDLA